MQTPLLLAPSYPASLPSAELPGLQGRLRRSNSIVVFTWLETQATLPTGLWSREGAHRCALRVGDGEGLPPVPLPRKEPVPKLVVDLPLASPGALEPVYDALLSLCGAEVVQGQAGVAAAGSARDARSCSDQHKLHDSLC